MMFFVVYTLKEQPKLLFLIAIALFSTRTKENVNSIALFSTIKKENVIKNIFTLTAEQKKIQALEIEIASLKNNINLLNQSDQSQSQSQEQQDKVESGDIKLLSQPDKDQEQIHKQLNQIQELRDKNQQLQSLFQNDDQKTILTLYDQIEDLKNQASQLTGLLKDEGNKYRQLSDAKYHNDCTRDAQEKKIETLTEQNQRLELENVQLINQTQLTQKKFN
jgi:chromosome segregation ATPase